MKLLCRYGLLLLHAVLLRAVLLASIKVKTHTHINKLDCLLSTTDSPSMMFNYVAI